MTAMPDHIWLDGRLVDAGEPHLLVTDRGFQLGDGIFETARARRGVIIEIDEHLERLREGATALGLALPWDEEALVDAIRDLLAAQGLAGTGEAGSAIGEASIRITVSRGPLTARGLLPVGFDTARPTTVIQALPYAPPPAELLARGLDLVVSAIRHDPQSPLAGVKSTSRADYVYAKLEALRAGADDALFFTTTGSIAEATSANIFVIRGRTLTTPPATAGILAGTTRTWLLRHADPLGYEPVQEDLAPADLLAADEAFLCSSVAGVVPVVRFGGELIGDGRPGVGTVLLREAREAWIDAMSLAVLVPEPEGPSDRTREPPRR